MGGNALAHLMPEPFYAYRFVVSKARSPEESIQGQLDKLIDASATKRYKLECEPGIYAEAVTMKAYCDVVAPYGRVIIRPPAGTTASVTMASNSMLQGVEIDNLSCDPSCTGIVIGALTEVIVEDCWVHYSTGSDATDIGISDASAGTTVIIRKCRIDSVGACYRKTGAGTTWVADTRMTSTTDGIDVDINLGTVSLVDNELMGMGTGANVDVAAAVIAVNSYGNTLAGDGWQIADGASAWVYSHNDNFTKVTHAGAGHMVATEEPQVYLVYNGMKIGDAITVITALTPTDTYRFTIRVFSGEYNEAVAMVQYVDLVGSSNQSVTIYQAAANVITAAANSRIISVRVELTAGDGKYGIYCSSVSYIEDVVIVITRASGTNYGVGSAGTGGFEIHDSVISCSHASDYPIGVDGSGTHLVYDSELINTAALAYGVFVGSADALSSFNNKIRSAAGFYLTSNDATMVLSYGDDFTTVVWSGATGLFADLSGARLYTCADTLAIGDWVYPSADDTVAKADADALATMPTIGRIVYKPTTTTCYVKNAGYAYDAAANAGFGDAWAFGQEYWVSATAGQITTTMHPVWPQRAGVAVDDKRFKILIGDNLGLVHCNEYNAIAETAMQGAQAYDVDGLPWTNETAAANNAVANDMTLLPAAPANGDAYYFGGVYPFGELNLQIGTAGVKLPGAWTLTWQYWNGAWTVLAGVADGTTEFTAAPGAHIVSFTLPSDWVASTLDGILAYWIRAIVSAATAPIGIQPRGTQCWTNSIGEGQWVYITTTNDHVGLALASAAATMGAIGVVVQQIATDTILVKLRGKNAVNDVTAAWVASDDVYISGTAGAITNIMPVMGIIQKVAEVKSFVTPVLIYEIAD